MSVGFGVTDGVAVISAGVRCVEADGTAVGGIVASGVIVGCAGACDAKSHGSRVNGATVGRKSVMAEGMGVFSVSSSPAENISIACLADGFSSSARGVGEGGCPSPSGRLICPDSSAQTGIPI